MKPLVLAAPVLCALSLAMHADIVIPKPNQIVVSNLSAFPKVKFTIAGGDVPLQEIREKKTYETNSGVQLSVEDAGHKPRVWAKVDRVQFRSELVKIRIKELRVSDKGMEVLYDTEKAPLPLSTPARKGASQGTSAWTPFLVAGAGSCGLLLLSPSRRRRQAARR